MKKTINALKNNQSINATTPVQNPAGVRELNVAELAKIAGGLNKGRPQAWRTAPPVTTKPVCTGCGWD